MGKPGEMEGGRCRRHPRHRHSVGVCPFCLRERLSRLSSSSLPAAASSSSAASSPCSSGEKCSFTTVAPSSLGEEEEEEDEEATASRSPQPPCRGRDARRARLWLLMRQEERSLGEKEVEEGNKRATRRNFWAKLLVLQGRSRKGGCSLTHTKALGEKSAAAKSVLF